MAGKEYMIINCPFCDKGEINLLHFPETWTAKRSYAAGKSKASGYLTKAEYVVQTDCPVCHKKADEIEKELKRQNII